MMDHIDESEWERVKKTYENNIQVLYIQQMQIYRHHSIDR